MGGHGDGDTAFDACELLQRYVGHNKMHELKSIIAVFFAQMLKNEGTKTSLKVSVLRFMSL
jgi:hypothetical protein